MSNGSKKFIQNTFHFSLAYVALLTLCNARQSGGDISLRDIHAGFIHAYGKEGFIV